MTTYEATAAAAEYLMASGWACEESVRATVEQGVSVDDSDAIREAFPAAADAEAVIDALWQLCRERVVA